MTPSCFWVSSWGFPFTQVMLSFPMPNYGDTSKGGGRPPSKGNNSGNSVTPGKSARGESIMDRKRREAKAQQSHGSG